MGYSQHHLCTAIQNTMNAPATPSHADQLTRTTRQAAVVQALQSVLPAHALLWHREDTTAYECDGLTAYRQRPLVVALPETEASPSPIPSRSPASPGLASGVESTDARWRLGATD